MTTKKTDITAIQKGMVNAIINQIGAASEESFITLNAVRSISTTAFISSFFFDFPLSSDTKFTSNKSITGIKYVRLDQGMRTAYGAILQSIAANFLSGFAD